MVNDKMEHLYKYVPAKKRKIIEQFLQQVSSNMKEGIYEIDSKEVYARIMSYPTKEKEECTIEAHDIYRDIQFTLIGSERISVYQRDKLTANATYDRENDFWSFHIAEPYIQVDNIPGYFTMLKPNEAHRPQESIDGRCAVVKKGVIKIKEECYG